MGEQVARAWRAGAILFTILAVVFGVVALRLRWASTHADFDVLGVLWVLQNVGPISVFLLFLTSALGAFYFWVRYLLSDR